MKILEKELSLDGLREMAASMFGDMVKGVVDVQRELIALDAELHSDLEAFLLDDGSRQQDLWGVNFYPFLEGDSFLEFDSMINMRPSQGNMSRGVDDAATRKKIAGIVKRWMTR